MGWNKLISLQKEHNDFLILRAVLKALGSTVNCPILTKESLLLLSKFDLIGNIIMSFSFTES
jgi:hypothetical protein